MPASPAARIQTRAQPENGSSAMFLTMVTMKSRADDGANVPGDPPKESGDPFRHVVSLWVESMMWPRAKCPGIHGRRNTLKPMLSTEEKAVLEFESSWWLQPGPKDQAIEFSLGLTAAGYYEALLALVEPARGDAS